MKFTVSTYETIKNLGIENALTAIKTAGFEGVDFSVFYDQVDVYLNGDLEKNAEYVKSLLNKNGLVVNQVHAPFAIKYNFTKEQQEIETEKIKKSIIFSRLLGSDYIVIHRIGVPEGIDAFQYNIDFYSKFIDTAKKHNVKIAIENLIHSEPTKTPETLLKLTNELNKICKIFVCCFDTGHGNLNNFKPSQFIDILKGNLKVLHINDNFGKEDLHLPPFDGNIDWVDFVSAIKKNNYDGNFNLELSVGTKNVSELTSSLEKLKRLLTL